MQNSFTLTLILSHSPYPSGNKSSLDACPPFLPSRERKKFSLPPGGRELE
jgi:hypothetical protein